MTFKNLLPIIGGVALAAFAITAFKLFPDLRRYRRLKKM